MFKKLDIVFDPIDIKKIKGDISRDYRINGTGFHEFAIVDFEYVCSIFDKKIKFTIKPNIIHIAAGSVEILPHSDLCNVSLNYYIEANGETTIFYRALDKKAENFSKAGWWKARHAENDHIWLPDKLEEIDSFVAKKNEVWPIKTAIPHGVKLNQGTPDRLMIRCVWHNRSYEEILDSLVLL